MRSLLKVQWMFDPHELWNVQSLSQSGESNTACGALWVWSTVRDAWVLLP